MKIIILSNIMKNKELRFSIDQLNQFKEDKGYQTLDFNEEGIEEELLEWVKNKPLTRGEETKKDIKRILLRELQDARRLINSIGTNSGKARGRTNDPLIKPALNLIDYDRVKLQRVLDGIETKVNLYIE